MRGERDGSGRRLRGSCAGSAPGAPGGHREHAAAHWEEAGVSKRDKSDRDNRSTMSNL